MVCAGAKPSFRLASCCNVDVVNGAAGDRFCVRVPIFVTTVSLLAFIVIFGSVAAKQ